MEWRKKHSSVSTPRNQPKGKNFQYELVKAATTEFNLDLKNVVGKTLDRAANMNGVHKGLSKRMAECYDTDWTIGKRPGDYPGSS